MRLDPVANKLTQGANYFSLPEFRFIIGFPDILSVSLGVSAISPPCVDGKLTTWALELDSETFFLRA